MVVDDNLAINTSSVAAAVSLPGSGGGTIYIFQNDGSLYPVQVSGSSARAYIARLRDQESPRQSRCVADADIKAGEHPQPRCA